MVQSTGAAESEHTRGLRSWVPRTLGDGVARSAVGKTRLGTSLSRKKFHMTRLKRTIAWSNLSKVGSAFLLVWLGAACGNASPTDESGSDGGPSGTATDEGDTGFASSTGSTDEGSTDGARADEAENTPTATGAVNLGTAGNYAVLAESGISSVPNCAITGNLGISPPRPVSSRDSA